MHCLKPHNTCLTPSEKGFSSACRVKLNFIMRLRLTVLAHRSAVILYAPCPDVGVGVRGHGGNNRRGLISPSFMVGDQAPA